jgi:hypothetical protein
MVPACWTSAYQPQPRSDGRPSASQVPAETLQTTRMTRPAAAARIGVYRGASRSTPSWAGRATVRKPLIRPAATGDVHVGRGQTGIRVEPRSTYASET